MDKKVIGVLSDTHELLRTEVIEYFKQKKVDIILHAGDIGNEKVLLELKKIAPVTAVRGNCDKDWAKKLPVTEMIDIGNEIFIYLIHDIKQLDIEPKALGLSMIISGHSHSPMLEEKDDIFYLNPGSCGPKRFMLPVSFALVKLESEKISTEMIYL